MISSKNSWIQLQIKSLLVIMNRMKHGIQNLGIFQQVMKNAEQMYVGCIYVHIQKFIVYLELKIILLKKCYG